MLLTIIIACLLAVSVVSAADNVTDDIVSVDSDDENQVVAQVNDEIMMGVDDGTFTALQNKINAAPSGSTITLENDYVYDDGFGSDGIVVKKSLTINGNGHTINGLSKSGIFILSYDSSSNGGLNSFSVNNINFINGYAKEYGGAIYGKHGTFTTGSGISNFHEYSWSIAVTGCTFKNNKAKYGGAIFVSNQYFSPKLTIQNSKFHDNEADYGGAIKSGKVESTFISCIFSNNRAKEGGAISGATHVESYTFSNNQVSGLGGAIFNCNNVNGCNFTNNQAKKGGAICMAKNINNCYFASNQASESGGAIFGGNGVNNAAGDATATKCTFYNNNAPEGKDVIKTTTTSCVFKTKSQTIKKTTPKLTASKMTFKKSVKTKKYTITLKNNKNKSLSGKYVTLNVNKKTYKLKTNSKGQVTFKITNLNKKGTFNAVVKFAGDKYYYSKTVNTKIIVK